MSDREREDFDDLVDGVIDVLGKIKNLRLLDPTVMEALAAKLVVVRDESAALMDEKGLHHLKDLWDTVRQMSEYCARLEGGFLKDAITDTKNAVPEARSDYLFAERNHDVGVGRMSDKQEERKLEGRIYNRWRAASPLEKPVEGLWDVFVGYQVPLYSTAKQAGWGKIDLFGFSSSDEVPVVLELKRAGSRETPLRAMLEGVAYAIAVRKRWEKIAKGITATYGSLPVPDTPDVIRVVVLAPERYWKQWRPDEDDADGNKLRRRHMKEAAKSFADLVRALGEKQYDVRFAEIGAHDIDDADASIAIRRIAFPAT